MSQRVEHRFAIFRFDGLGRPLLLDTLVGIDDPNDLRVRQIYVLRRQAERHQLVGMVPRAEIVIGPLQIIVTSAR